MQLYPRESVIRHFGSEMARHHFTLLDRGTMHLISVTSVEEEMPAKRVANRANKK